MSKKHSTAYRVIAALGAVAIILGALLPALVPSTTGF